MSAPAAASRRALALATLAAAALALLVLVLFVLPAEYGVDPTGVGRATGLTRLAPQEAPPPAPVETAPPLVLRTYESRFPVTLATLSGRDGYLAEGDTTLIPFPVDAPNVTRVLARLEFVDANATASGQRTRPDTFEVELKAPHGDVTGAVLARSDAKTGGGRAEATFDFREPPHPREWDAASPEEARAAFLRNDPPDRSLSGEWQARVTLVEAGDAEVSGVALPGASGPADADHGNAWTLTLLVETFALEVAEKPGAQRRADAVTLTIPARGELEYKLRVNFGARVDYAWTTEGGALYYDFHGEKSGDASGAFTRHGSGTASQDAGALVAPFDGTHGWYWRNDGAAPVTVTLETRGAYEVVGVPR